MKRRNKAKTGIKADGLDDLAYAAWVADIKRKAPNISDTELRASWIAAKTSKRKDDEQQRSVGNSSGNTAKSDEP